MKKHSSLVFLSVLIFLGFPGCSQRQSSISVSPENLSGAVVVTQFPLDDWCENILPDAVSIVNLRQIKRDEISSLTVKEAKALHGAPMLISFNELGVDELNNMAHSTLGLKFTNLPTKQKRGPLLAPDLGEESDFHTLSDNLYLNRFPWLDPIWAQEAIQQISSRCKEEWPEWESQIEKRSQAYLYQIYEIHIQLAEIMQNFSVREYISQVDWYDPFLKRYGFHKKEFESENKASSFIDQIQEWTESHPDEQIPFVLLASTVKNRKAMKQLQGIEHILLVPNPVSATNREISYLNFLKTMLDQWKESTANHAK